MAYAADDKLPETYIQTLTKKANMLRKHLKDTNSSLVICANIGPNMATFKLYNTQEEDSLKLHYTISNLGDLGDPIVPIMGTNKILTKRTLSIQSIKYFKVYVSLNRIVLNGNE